jgi:hypothetical protein
MVTLQVDLPAQAPDQLSKCAPFTAVAVSVTTVPAVNDALQVGEQLIPAGLLVTVPLEEPAKVIVSL